MPTSEFFEVYWQKKPCLLRQAIAGFENAFNRQELYEIASQPQVESRVVLEKDGDYPWQVLHGPFDIEDFKELPPDHWSLLIQNAEHYLQSAHSLLDKFNFIPNWRVDDLMISYAPDAGSVGPHFDSYDVFLYQAMGERSWSINRDGYDDSSCIDGLDLRIIDGFQAQEEFTLLPGDMLYLPPGIGHHGIAIGESMTCSIGFRAPSSHELLSGFVDYVLQHQIDTRYTDPDLTQRKYPGEISKAELKKIDTLFRSALPGPEELADWFARFASCGTELELGTDTKAGENRDDITHLLKKEQSLYKPQALRVVFIRKEPDVVVYVCGEAYTLPARYLQFVHDFSSKQAFRNPVYATKTDHDEVLNLLHSLYCKGLLAPYRS